MSTAMMRRDRDERSGGGDSRFTAGVQESDGEYPAERERPESSFDAVDGADISDEADYDADLHNESGATSADAVEGYEVSDNDDPAAHPDPWHLGLSSQESDDKSAQAGRAAADDVDNDGIETSADAVEGANVSAGDEGDDTDDTPDE